MNKLFVKIIMYILIIILILLFMIINMSEYFKYNNNKVTSTTTKGTTSIIDNTNTITITINGEDINISMREYSSYLGFTVPYDIDKFKVSQLSDSSVLISNLDNSNIYIKIEKMTQNDYYAEYETQQQQVTEGIYIYNYKFFRGNNIYLKITKCIIDNTEYNTLNSIMDYSISNIKLN